MTYNSTLYLVAQNIAKGSEEPEIGAQLEWQIGGYRESETRVSW